MYKFLNIKEDKIVSEHGVHEWEVGKTYSVTGKVKLCGNGFHCSKEPLQALGYVKGDVVAIVNGSGDCLKYDDKLAYRSMTITKAYRWTQKDSVSLAIYAAEQVIKIYEDKYPNDSIPRDAIKAAKAYLKDPSKKNKDAAKAANAAHAAAYAAKAANAAHAAAYAANAAHAAHAAAYAAYAAAYAANAAHAADADTTAKINRWIKRHIKTLEAIK